MLKVRPLSSTLPLALETLKRHRVLGAAPDEELRAMLRDGQVVSAAARDQLFHQGDPGRSVAVMLSGYVKLSSLAPAGREIVLEICGPGGLFGELAVLNDWTRSATATALGACEVLSIGGDALRTGLRRSPDAMFALLGVLSRRLRVATGLIVDATLPAPGRLAKALGQLLAAHGRTTGAGLQLDIALSQGELGSMTGLSRETINKLLSAWRDQGWIELSPRHLVLVNAGALQDLVEQSL